MVRVSGLKKSAMKSTAPTTAEPKFSLADFGADSEKTFDRIAKAQNVSIGNAERPSNIWYRINGQSSYWYMYALMDWYRSEVSVLSTIILRSTMELFRYDLELLPRFAVKCDECKHEFQTMVEECPYCGSTHLREPDISQKEYFKRPNGKSFLEEANDNGQTLKDVLRAYAESEYQNNQAYTVCVTGDIYNTDDGQLERAYPLEFISVDPKFVKYLYDDTGKPGTTFAFVRRDRNNLINLDEDPEAYNDYNDRGEVLYPAAWQVGSNYGGTGAYWLYTAEEVYQDHWFRQSLIYGIPIWYDIEDDMLTYHYIEKHNLKKYKYGYVRKMVILPGFNDEDVEDITKGIQDILATNDNSIPIICTPPQLNSTAEMRAQTLELGTESSSDLMQIKDDIRDRMCAMGGVPNLFAGDVESSGGMNNESQQITVFDRYLMDKYNYIDRQCRWIMSWFPQITDWELTIARPSKAYTDTKRRLDRIQEAQMMKQLGFDIYYRDGEFRYGQEPQDQIERKMQEQQGMMGGMPMEGDPNQPVMDGGMLPGDGDGPPEEGTARRADPEMGDSADEVDLSKRESAGAYDI